jgi:hypothetical protein
VIIYFIFYRRTVSSTGQCLVNAPGTQLKSYYGSLYLPGQFYTPDQQCQFLYGLSSSYSACSVSIVLL